MPALGFGGGSGLGGTASGLGETRVQPQDLGGQGASLRTWGASGLGGDSLRTWGDKGPALGLGGAGGQP